MSETVVTPGNTQAPAQTQEGAPRAAAAKKQAAEEAAAFAHAEEMRALEIEAKRLEIQERNASVEAKRLEILERTANAEDTKERLEERKLRRESIFQKAYTNGATLRDTKQREEMIQRRCNHRKGGNGAAGVQLGQGDNPQHAVIKHSMMNGDMWVRCQRCGKTWKPPIKADYTDIELYVKALTEYENAKNFQTNNTPSSSQQFQWSDNGAYSREVLRNTTLR